MHHTDVCLCSILGSFEELYNEAAMTQANRHWCIDKNNGMIVDIILTRVGITAREVRYELSMIIRSKVIRGKIVVSTCLSYSPVPQALSLYRLQTSQTVLAQFLLPVPQTKQATATLQVGFKPMGN